MGRKIERFLNLRFIPRFEPIILVKNAYKPSFLRNAAGKASLCTIIDMVL